MSAGKLYAGADHLTGICVPELVRNDAGGDADRSDRHRAGKSAVGVIKASACVRGRASSRPSSGQGVERAEEAQALDEFTDKRIDRDHAFGLQLAERHVNRPSIRADIVEAIIGKIDTFTDAHAGVAQQQQDIGGQIIAAEQFLLD